MKQYTVFGCNAYLGDLAEIVGRNGMGIISKVVFNQPERIKERTPTRNEIIAKINQYYLKFRPTHSVVQLELEEFRPIPDEAYLICFTGGPAWNLAQQLKQKYQLKFDTIIHDSAIISYGCQLQEGVNINASCTLAPNVIIKPFTRINRGVLIGHDTVIGSGVSVQPGANIAGLVTIGHGAIINLGAIITDRITIGAGALIAAGAVVLDDVPPNTMVAGIPAVVKTHLGD